jgi:hypothetical protein
MKRVWLSLLVILVLVACTPAANCDGPSPDPECKRVLFIGNSYTYVNDMPGMFAALAKAGGHPVKVSMVANGGWYLKDHAASADTINAITGSTWDIVVLQEQSATPAYAYGRQVDLFPAAQSLANTIWSTGATPYLFLTPAYRDGWPDAGLNSYTSMQDQINIGYWDISARLGLPFVPVGIAWGNALARDPGLVLWQTDGSHPTKQGTYLGACVFYATIFRESPVGLSYRAGLSKAIATELQTVAAETELNTP